MTTANIRMLGLPQGKDGVNRILIMKTRPTPTHPKGLRSLNLWLLIQTTLHHEVCEVNS